MMSENFDHEQNAKDSNGSTYSAVPYDEGSSSGGDTDHSQANAQNHQEPPKKLLSNPRIHDAFMGVGEYGHLALPNGDWGLGFKRVISADGSVYGFGHSGMGGSTGFCDPRNRFSIAVTLNKMSFGGVTGEISTLVCSELNIPVPRELRRLADQGPNSDLDSRGPLIN